MTRALLTFNFRSVYPRLTWVLSLPCPNLQIWSLHWQSNANRHAPSWSLRLTLSSAEGTSGEGEGALSASAGGAVPPHPLTSAAAAGTAPGAAAPRAERKTSAAERSRNPVPSFNQIAWTSDGQKVTRNRSHLLLGLSQTFSPPTLLSSCHISLHDSALGRHLRHQHQSVGDKEREAAAHPAGTHRQGRGRWCSLHGTSFQGDATPSPVIDAGARPQRSPFRSTLCNVGGLRRPDCLVGPQRGEGPEEVRRGR